MKDGAGQGALAPSRCRQAGNKKAGPRYLVAALHRHGVETRRARRLVVFVPMAFGRDLASRMHVRTRLDVSIRRADGSWVTRPLQAFPEFRVAEELTQQLGRDDYSALARRSAEVAVISKALDDGSGVEGGEVRSVTPWDLL